jgi:tripartite-type tricarboxylate transporter receptor subunit TctC
VNTLQEFVAYAQKNPGKLSYGSSGPGSGTHFAGEYFKLLTRTHMVHIPYKSTSAAAADVAAGLLDLTFDATAKPFADAGKVKIIAVTGDQRDPRMPNVPTTAEAGLKAFTLNSWVGMLAPPETPAAVVERLNHAVATALAEPGLRKIMNDMGVTQAGGPAARMEKTIVEEVGVYRRIVKDTNLKIE